MGHQRKKWHWFGFCWIIKWLQLVSASRETLMLSQFQKKLDVFHSDMELLKFDISNIQHTVSNLNNTCHCKENERTFKNALKDANNTKFVNRQFNNNGIVQTLSKFSDSDKTLSTRLLKAFKDEKKHTREQLDEMLVTIEEVYNQEKIFQTSFEARYHEHEKKVIQLESNISEMVQEGQAGVKKHMDSEIETLKQEKTVMEVEFDNKLRAYKENTDKLTKVLKKNEQEITVMKEYISKMEHKINSLAILVDKQKELDNCINSSDNWVPNKEFGSSFLVVGTSRTWSQAKVICQERCSYLVELTTSEKQAFIQNLYKNKSGSTQPEFWTGGNDLETEGEWMWYHSGLSINRGFRYWRENEPNNHAREAKGEEDCLGVKTDDNRFRWNDIPCWYECPFVCEKKMINTF